MAQCVVKRSFVSDLIDFEALENPTWRKKDSDSVQCMIKRIVSSQRQWHSLKESCKFNEELVNQIRHESHDMLLRFIFHSTNEEGEGYETIEDTQNCLEKKWNRSERLPEDAQKTLNFKEAYDYLSKLSTESDDDHGLIEASMLKQINKLILKNLVSPNGFTKPGVFSDKQRITEFKGEIHFYPQPEDMEEAVCTILDRYNSLFNDFIESMDEKDEEVKLYKLFKTCSWLIFELLDLHPFSDGNGRLCRLLCSYVLSRCTPFPTPVYNIVSDSCLDNFKQALVDARESKHRYPRSLTTMIIECNLKGWEHFLEKVQQCEVNELQWKGEKEY